ncbi:hypothetical protein [Sphingobacterium suaedae]|uniref:Uncharacterized protein n=1 Tax=Sphingobacterium suaedae TaxID=1686402 RepID=A0ABW5KII0_9SPHI
MGFFHDESLANLGFSKYEWNDEDLGKVVDHKFENKDLSIEITNYQTVEITTRGQYITLPSITNTQKLEELIKLLTK